MVGKKISHYKILEKLGEGGMGIVYKAFDTKLERTVALKLLQPETIGDADAKKRFIREARAASALNHPNITTIHEINEYHGRDFICMEYVEGLTLREMVKPGPLPIKEVLQIAEQVAEALQEAHDSHIVHRDIKSENIMVTPKGQVKVMDFGIAKLKGMKTVTKVGTPMGTVSYMSPEQALAKDVDFRTDIWSFGVALYEMITGQLPFNGDNEQAVIYLILNEKPESTTKLRGDIPAELDIIINNCLEKDKQNRYQRINDLLIDLRKVKRVTSRKAITSSDVKRTATKITKTQGAKNKKKYIWLSSAIFVVMAAICAVVFWPSGSNVLLNPNRTIRTLNLPFKQIMYPSISADGNWIAFPAVDVKGNYIFLTPQAERRLSV